MTELTQVNPQVVDSINRTKRAASSTEENGTGRAFQFVAQSTAMAVQDATDNLRNVSSISTTAIGVAMAQLMSSGDEAKWGPVIEKAQNIVSTCADDFKRIGDSAADVLKNFPQQPAGAPPDPSDAANNASQTAGSR